MQKAVITPSRPSAAFKGKGRAYSEEPPEIATAVEKPPTTAAPASTSDSALVSVKGDLHLYDRATGFFMIQEKDVQASIHKTDAGHWLLVEGEKGPWVSMGLDTETNFSEVSRFPSLFLAGQPS